MQFFKKLHLLFQLTLSSLSPILSFNYIPTYQLHYLLSIAQTKIDTEKNINKLSLVNFFYSFADDFERKC